MKLRRHLPSTVSAVVISVAVLLLSACSAGSDLPVSSSAKRDSIGSGRVEERIRAHVRRWVGTPHRMGGQGAAGFDCSGFVQMVFRDEFAVQLPRTTNAQWNVGRSVSSAGLRAGDLVFFQPGTYPRHVGIYLSAGEFVHVSAKKGVMVSHTGDPYWTRHFSHARRVLSH